MVVSIHQPNFLPWPGYYQKMSMSDVFVFLDSVKYSKNSFINRNRFTSGNNDSCWITVPVGKKFTSSIINQVELTDRTWIKKHVKFFEQRYSKTSERDYLDSLLEQYSRIGKEKSVNLADFNISLIMMTKEVMGIECEIVKASDLSIDRSLKKQDLIFEILTELNCSKYVSGTGAKSYQQESCFDERGIELEYTTGVNDSEFLYNDSFVSASDFILREGACKLLEKMTLA